jgi:hypothetical protein
MANLIVTGTLVPDATGTYIYQNAYLYTRTDGAYQIVLNGVWLIWESTHTYIWALAFGGPTGRYNANGIASGIATVAYAPTANTGRVIAEGIIHQ